MNDTPYRAADYGDMVGTEVNQATILMDQVQAHVHRAIGIAVVQKVDEDRDRLTEFAKELQAVDDRLHHWLYDEAPQRQAGP